MGTAPPGRFLAIETSGSVGSVALGVDGEVAARRFLTVPSRHAAGLVPALRDVLDDAGVARRELTGIVVGAGPGSFTGVRIAAAAAKGLAASLEIPLYPTSSLGAAAFTIEAMGPHVSLPAELTYGDAGGAQPRAICGDEREVRYVLFDSRGGRVYGACYDVGASGPVEVVPPHGGTIVDVLNRRPPLGTAFTGDGAAAHSTVIRAAGYVLLGAPAGIPVADAVFRCCPWDPVDPADWEPDYVRAWKAR